MSIVDVRDALSKRPYIRPGARPYHKRPRDGVGGVTIHYTASRAATTVWSTALYQVSPQAQEAFPAIAYHLFIEAEGTVYLCHDLETRVWHSGANVSGVARNLSHIGICYAGDREPNAAQIAGLHEAIAWCEAQLGRNLEVEGHKDAYATTCPGPTWPSWKDDVLEEAMDRNALVDALNGIWHYSLELDQEGEAGTARAERLHTLAQLIREKVVEVKRATGLE